MLFESLKFLRFEDFLQREREREMEIKVKYGCGEGSFPEWVIVELQGVVESQPSFEGQLQGMEIGHLCCSSQRSYTFTVGYHEQFGMKMPLKKPLVVARKRRAATMDEMDSSIVELEVIGVIQHRILFHNRPKPLVSKPQIKEKKIV